MVNPALLTKLCHDGVNPWKTCPAFCPFGQSLRILIPRDLNTYGVPFHFIKAWVVCCCCIEKFTPQKLPIEREGRGAIFLYLQLKSKEVLSEKNVKSISKNRLWLQIIPFCRDLLVWNKIVDMISNQIGDKGWVQWGLQAGNLHSFEVFQSLPPRPGNKRQAHNFLNHVRVSELH